MKCVVIDPHSGCILMMRCNSCTPKEYLEMYPSKGQGPGKAMAQSSENSKTVKEP